MSRRAVGMLAIACWAVAILAALAYLWQHPIRTPTLDGAGASVTVQVSGEATVSVRDHVACVTIAGPDGRMGVVFPSSFTAYEPGLLQAGMTGPAPEVVDGDIRQVVLRSGYHVTVAAGAVVDSRSGGPVVAAWEALCAPVPTVYLATPYGVALD